MKQEPLTTVKDTGHSTLLNHRETLEGLNSFLDSASVIPGTAECGNGVVFNTKYEDPSTNVIANVTSVGDLREKVTLSWKNINVFVPQPRASLCRRLCCGKKEDEPRIKQILSDGKSMGHTVMESNQILLSGIWNKGPLLARSLWGHS